MKNFIFLVIIFFQQLTFSQDCDHFALKTDITNNPDFASLIQEKPQLIPAWKLIRDAIPNIEGTTQFALDPKTLEKVTEMLAEGSSFRNTFPETWQIELSTIIGKNNTLPCETCGTPGGLTVSRYNMDIFLDQVIFFTGHYDVNGVAQKFYNWLKRISADGSGTMNAPGNIEELYQTLYHLKSQGITNVVDFGSKFPQGPKEYDLFFGGTKYTELKNVDFVNSGISIETQDQLIYGYFANIDNINDLQWIAHFKKLQASGWSSISIAETNLKTMWKSIFVARKDEIFNAMKAELKNSLEIEIANDLTSAKIDQILNTIIKVH